MQVRRAGLKPFAKSFDTKADAKRWARTLESEMDRGIFVDRTEAERTTMAELIDRYRLEVTPMKKSARNEAQRLNQLRRHFGAFSLAAIRNTHIADYRDARLAGGLAGATVVKELNSLSHLFDVAVKDWGIPMVANPAKLVRRPRVARGRPEIKGLFRGPRSFLRQSRLRLALLAKISPFAPRFDRIP